LVISIREEHPLENHFPVPATAAIALLAAAVFAVATVAQAPQGPPQGPPKVRNLGKRPPATHLSRAHQPEGTAQGHDRTADPRDHGRMGRLAGGALRHLPLSRPQKPGPNGRPRLKFDDDSKPEKQMARIMYKMTEDMKKNYIEKVADMDKMDSPAAPLTCGTCHRGHLDPEEFVPRTKKALADPAAHLPREPCPTCLTCSIRAASTSASRQMWLPFLPAGWWPLFFRGNRSERPGSPFPRSRCRARWSRRGC